MAHVVVIIVSYRNVSDVLGCVAALARSTHRDMEVHICENGGTAAFNTLCAELASMSTSDLGPQCIQIAATGKLIAETRKSRLKEKETDIDLHLHHASGNLGYAGGINAVLTHIAADRQWGAVWILNPDTVPTPDALAALAARAAQGNYGVVGSRLVLEQSSRIHLRGGRWRPLMARGFNIGFGDPLDHEPDSTAIERELDYVAGTSMYVTREFINNVGGMDERYFLYAEEVDWCFRRGSYQLGYAHASIVFHKHGTTIGSDTDLRRRSALSIYLNERNKLLLTRRFFPVLYPVVILTTLLLLAQYLKAGAFKSFKVALKGWLAGVRGEQGAPPCFAPQLDREIGDQQFVGRTHRFGDQ